MTKQLIRIGYQGIRGSNSEIATEEFIRTLRLRWLGDAETEPFVSSRGVIQALLDGRVDFGVVAVRNKIAGEVKETKDALRPIVYNIADTISIPISYCVCIHPSVSLSEITAIASHPQALAQTAKARAQHFPNLQEVETPDTALAAQQLAEGALPRTTAVLCSKTAGRIYDLNIVFEHLGATYEDEFGIKQTNKTEFLMVYVDKSKESLLCEEHLSYCQIPNEVVDDIVRQYSKENPTKMTISWGAIRRRLEQLKDLHVGPGPIGVYDRTLRRYTVVDEHQNQNSTVFLVPKELAATLHGIEPHAYARAMHLSQRLQGGHNSSETVQVAKRDTLVGKFKRLFGK